jgi:hypothetical protein
MKAPGPPMTQSRKQRSRSGSSSEPGFFSMIGKPMIVILLATASSRACVTGRPWLSAPSTDTSITLREGASPLPSSRFAAIGLFGLLTLVVLLLMFAALVKYVLFR